MMQEKQCNKFMKTSDQEELQEEKEE